MNRLEKDYIKALMQYTVKPMVEAASFDNEHGYLSNHAEAIRLMDSADYRAGWEACHARLKDVLVWLMKSPPSEVRKQLRQLSRNDKMTEANRRNHAND